MSAPDVCEEAVEQAARTLFECHCREFGLESDWFARRVTEAFRDTFRDKARAALTAAYPLLYTQLIGELEARIEKLADGWEGNVEVPGFVIKRLRSALVAFKEGEGEGEKNV